jgi:hypothetical protein
MVCLDAKAPPWIGGFRARGRETLWSRPSAAGGWEWSGGKLSYKLLVHGFSELVVPGHAAAAAPVNHFPARAGDHDRERLHQPPASRRAVTRVNVHVPGPETAGAVVRIAIALYEKPTAGTAEVLDAAHEAAAHQYLLACRGPENWLGCPRLSLPSRPDE